MCVCLIEKPIFTSFSRLPHSIWDDVIVKIGIHSKTGKLDNFTYFWKPSKTKKEIKRKRVNYTLIVFRKQLQRRCFLCCREFRNYFFSQTWYQTSVVIFVKWRLNVSLRFSQILKSYNIDMMLNSKIFVKFKSYIYHKWIFQWNFFTLLHNVFTQKIFNSLKYNHLCSF